MLARVVFWLFVSQHILAALAATDAIDFEKSPGGGPSTLRGCAQYAYNGNSRAGSVWDLGCKAISCICRSDLVQQAYDSITNAVVANCGKDATVDVQQALNVYNAYCSANGHAIPGYTLTSTLTLPAPTTPSQAPITTSPNPRLTTPANSPLPTAAATEGTIVPLSIATVTATIVVKSWGTKAQPWGIFQQLYFMQTFPIRIIQALADSVVVTYTLPAPSTDVPVVLFTTYTSGQAVPATTVATVYDKTPQLAATVGSGTSSDTPTAGAGGGAQGPGTLELVGIIIGIIAGLITTVATVWMCVRKK